MNLKDLFLGFFIAAICMGAYIKYETTLRMDGQTYTHAGMAEIAPGIYAPVYRRTK